MVPPLLRVRGGLPLILWFLDVVVDVVLDLVLLCCDVLLVLEAARQLVQPLENPWLRHQFLLQLICLQPFNIYSMNIKCVLAHLSELCHYVNLYAPHVVLIQESWLNASIENVNVPNYKVLSKERPLRK